MSVVEARTILNHVSLEVFIRSQFGSQAANLKRQYNAQELSDQVLIGSDKERIGQGNRAIVLPELEPLHAHIYLDDTGIILAADSNTEDYLLFKGISDPRPYPLLENPQGLENAAQARYILQNGIDPKIIQSNIPTFYFGPRQSNKLMYTATFKFKRPITI